MVFMEKHLHVKRSTLPGAGKGLFTKKMIPKGTRILEYKGRITTWKEAANADNGYIYYVKRNHVIDAKPFPKALGRYSNDARGLKKVTGITNNAEYIEEGLKVFINAKKDIPAGGEIFVSYGKEYWEVIRYNLKIDKANKKVNHKRKSK
jgi:SET domain-containing protein